MIITLKNNAKQPIAKQVTSVLDQKPKRKPISEELKRVTAEQNRMMDEIEKVMAEIVSND